MQLKQRPNRFLYLLRYALPYRREVALQFLLMGLAVGAGLLKPWPLKVIVDHVGGDLPLVVAGWVVPWEPTALLLLSCLAYLLIHGGDSVITMGSTLVATLTSSRMTRDLRAEMVRCLQALSLKFHDSHRVGDLVHRVAWNTQVVETAFQSGFMGAVKSALTLAAILVIMAMMNVRLTLVAVVTIPLLLTFIKRYAGRIQQVSRRHQDQEGRVSSRLQELLGGIRLVQAFNRQGWEQERFDALSDTSIATRLDMTRMQAWFGVAVALTLGAGTALMFWIGMREVLAVPQRLTLGEFLVFNAYLAMLYAPLSVLSYTASSIQSALGGGQRLFEILEAVNEARDRPDARPLAEPRGAIRLEDVSFAYDEGRPILRGVSLQIAPGSMLAVVGETGSGKSTLLSLLLRFYHPTGGRILIGGQDLSECTLASLREQVSLVPQEAVLFSDSIRENIVYGKPQASEAEIVQAARLAQADEFIRAMPEGYETLVGERGVRLSVGQRQRIALARAFLRDAPILLLDEPTSALDAETEERLMGGIEAFARERTVITVAHRLSTVAMADRIVVLGAGEVLEQGTHEELLAGRGAYWRLWQAQHERPGAVVPAEGT